MEIPVNLIYMALFLLLIPMVGTTVAMLVGVLSYIDAHRTPNAAQTPDRDSLRALTMSLRVAARWLGHTVADVPNPRGAITDAVATATETEDRRSGQRRRGERRQNERRIRARGKGDRRRQDRRRVDRRNAAAG